MVYSFNEKYTDLAKVVTNLPCNVPCVALCQFCMFVCGKMRLSLVPVSVSVGTPYHVNVAIQLGKLILYVKNVLDGISSFV